MNDTTYNTHEDNDNMDLTKLHDQIASVDFTIEALLDDSDQPYYDIEVSRSAQKKMVAMVHEGITSDFDTDKFTALVKASTLASAIDERARLVETAGTPLMHVESPYLITDGELISPAGFSRDDRIFVKTGFAKEFEGSFMAHKWYDHWRDREDGKTYRIYDMARVSK